MFEVTTVSNAAAGGRYHLMKTHLQKYPPTYFPGENVEMRPQLIFSMM